MKPVNLLPESQRRRPAGDAKTSYVALGVLGALVLLVGNYVWVSNQATSRENDAAKAAVEATELEARSTEIGAYGDFAQTKEMRAASVRQLADSRFDWERLMRELALVLPAGGWLQGAKASVTGETDAASSSGATGSPSATLTGCMPRQSDVATLMLRLGRMHRVEDVTLQESKRGEPGSVPTLDGCGPYYQFDILVAFSAAAPTEAPDGETRVPASLGGGS